MAIIGSEVIIGGTRSCLQLNGSSWLDEESSWLDGSDCWLDDESQCGLDGSHCGLDERIFGWAIDCESIFGEAIIGGTIDGVAIVGEAIVRGDGAVATRHLAAHGGRDKHLIFSV